MRARLLRGIVPLLVLALGGSFTASCGVRTRSHFGKQRHQRAALQALLTRLEQPGLVLGEFALAPDPVIDGDTIKVGGLKTTLRLLGIDTEETYKNQEDRRGAAADFDAYVKRKQGDGFRPRKMATPLGEAAKHFAEEFFDGVEVVRLERDHPRDLRGRYNRYLVYVFAKKNGEWVNYNVECVRAGMSPYFTKYGYSRRFHAQFRKAHREAQENAVGIWDEALQHYPDYDRRQRWWDSRADFVKQFEEDAGGKDEFIHLTHWDAIARLEGHEGMRVDVLATVSEVRLGDKGPTKVMLGRRRLQDFPVIFFDKDLFGSTGLADYRGEFVRIRGPVTRYRNPHTEREELQIIVKSTSQVLLSSHPEPLTRDSLYTAQSP